MTENTSDSSAREGRLDAILAEYLQSVDAGTPIDRQVLLERYPEFTDELREFLDDREAFGMAAGPFLPREASGARGRDDETRAGGAIAAARPGLRVRYFGEYELLAGIA